ncbi:hypothetical protein RAHE111665_04810 [Rariglobus hedericola]
MRRDLKRFLRHFRRITVAELTTEQLINYFNLGKPMLKTYNNRRGIVSTFLKFAFQRGWITENPWPRFPATGFAGSHLNVLRCESRGTHAARRKLGGWPVRPYFALCLFAGIHPCLRTGEILRLKPELVNLEAGMGLTRHTHNCLSYRPRLRLLSYLVLLACFKSIFGATPCTALKRREK